MLVPLAPASTLVQRFPLALKSVLTALGLPDDLIASEIQGRQEVTYAKTSNRSVLGVMNEFAFLSEGYRADCDRVDPLALSLKLAGTPCGPLFKTTVFPDKSVRELVYGGRVH